MTPLYPLNKFLGAISASKEEGHEFLCSSLPLITSALSLGCIYARDGFDVLADGEYIYVLNQAIGLAGSARP